MWQVRKCASLTKNCPNGPYTVPLTRERGDATLCGVTKPSLLYQLIEAKLPGTLADFVAARRATQPWGAIAEELSTLTGHDVSDETLRRWFADRITVEVKIA
jgi:hypothetical protein